MSVTEPPQRPADVEQGPRPLATVLAMPARKRFGWFASPHVRVLGALAYGLIVIVVLSLVVAPALDRLRVTNVRLTANVGTQPGQTRSFLAIVYDLESRWVGQPPLWQPSVLPANTVVKYFAISGATQVQLIDSIDRSGICTRYQCLVDPAVPPGTPAWALEIDGYIVPSAAYCYTPRTISYRFAQHTILMPGWSPRIATVQTLLVQRWNALEGVLLTHEAGHVKIADDYLAGLNAQSERLSSCQAFINFWSSPHLWDGLDAAQNAYHARLRADCRPEIGCIPAGWMGW